jgi:putative FmdB family regulatory protein
VPIYEYVCATCGEFEVTQRITDAPLKRCPTCRGKVRKLISASSFQLKGTGWYLTDYARSGNHKSEKKSGGDSAASESKGQSDAPAKGSAIAAD